MVPTGQHKTWRIPDLRPGEYIWRLIPMKSPTAALYGNVVDRVKARKKLVVGSSVTPDAVFQRINADTEEWGGFDIELMTVIAHHMKVEPVFEPVVWSDLFKELKRQHVDVVISGMTRLPDRERDHGVMFTDGYATTHQRLVTRAGVDEVRFPESLQMTKIGVVGGDPETTNSRALTFLQKQWKSEYPFDIVPHNRLSDLVSAVKRGDVLMGLFDDLNAAIHVKRGDLEWVGPPLDEWLKESTETVLIDMIRVGRWAGCSPDPVV